MRALEVVAPRAADRLAADLFCAPRRGKPADPGGHRFDVFPGIAAWDWGEGPTVILAHGWNGSAAQMSPFVEPLVRAGFYVVAFDEPAHGSSIGRRATAFDFAEALLAVSRRVKPIHAIVAHSLGATGAALALSRGLKADRAVLLAPPAEMGHFARVFAGALGLRRTGGVLRELRRTVGEELPDLRLLAPGFSARALMLHDPSDREVPFAHTQELAAAWPGARLEALPGAGHSRILRNRDAIQRAVAFVSQGQPAEALRSA
jgi:pimeloyl-ACP methyl ester carboxylesterase